MPSGLRLDTDVWLKEHETVKQTANDIAVLIQDRNVKFPNGGQEASRITAGARRKLGSLGSAIDGLQELLESKECSVSANEKNRRRDLITQLKSRREHLLLSLKRDQSSDSRGSYLDGMASSSSGPARETERTAELDNRGLLQMQEQVMKEQDKNLEELEKYVQSSKHIAVTINDELHLQERLLDELDEDVDQTHFKLKVIRKRVAGVLKKSGDCKCQLLIVLLVAALIAILILVVKIF